MVQTRAQKKAQMSQKHDIDAALVLLKLRKDHDDMLQKELQKKKEELAILREIKILTDEYNMMRMIVRSYDEKADALEIRITKLMSSLDN